MPRAYCESQVNSRESCCVGDRGVFGWALPLEQLEAQLLDGPVVGGYSREDVLAKARRENPHPFVGTWARRRSNEYT